MGEDGRPDMVNRDPNNLNENLSATFEEVFGEPDATHSPECAWKCGFNCYEGSRKCCYLFCTAISTWCAGLYWGCFYACMSCCLIWWVTPGLKCYKILFNCTMEYVTSCIDCCCGTMCSAYGNMFSRIKVQQG
ncbi:caveolin-3-like [Watersipora subatra]|uniref:caveolin-3-like n=1 Tax=Watersipora subatra TaxID=2589382 RepID=UPI00355B7BAE